MSGLWVADLLDYVSDRSGVLSFFGGLLALGGTLVVREGFRQVGLATLIAGVLGVGLLLGSFFYRQNFRAIYGLDGIRVFIPSEFSTVRRDSSSRSVIQKNLVGLEDKTYQDELDCGVVEKASDGSGDNSVALSTRYSKISPAQLLAENCPRVDSSDFAKRQEYFAQFAKVLAYREDRNVADIRMIDAAWIGDKQLENNPSLGGCRFSWALNSTQDTFFVVFVAMPRQQTESPEACRSRRTLYARLVMSEKRPNNLTSTSDYRLLWESVWKPLREELKRRNNDKPVNHQWDKKPPAPEPWPKPQPQPQPQPPVKPPVNMWSDPCSTVPDCPVP